MPIISNPFSTRFTRPGAIPFQFDRRLGADLIFRRFAASNFRAQIVGPHGSGKTTLVRWLEPDLNKQFANIKYLIIRKVSNRIVVESQFARARHDQSGRPDLLVVDGVESLSRLHRWLLKAWCQKNKTGLLTTVHRPSLWLPTIATLRPEVGTFLTLCDWLQRSSEGKLDHASCLKAFKLAKGNVREGFMWLYDQYELATARSAHHEPVKV